MKSDWRRRSPRHLGLIIELKEWWKIRPQTPLLEVVGDQQVRLPTRASEENQTGPIEADSLVKMGERSISEVPPTIGTELVVFKEPRVADPGKKRRKKKDHGDSSKRQKTLKARSSKGKEVVTAQRLKLLERNRTSSRGK